MIPLPPSLRPLPLLLSSLAAAATVSAEIPMSGGLMGQRFLTMNTVVRVRQIEVARDQVNRDLHEGLKRFSEIVGNGYRPKSVVAGFLSAENLRYLAEEEGIHV